MQRKKETGEDYSSAFLKGSFERIWTPTPNDPIDRSCQALFQARNSSLLWEDPTCSFHFQIKGGAWYKKNGIEIQRSTFECWLEHVMTEPVFLLYVRQESATAQEYWFLNLYSWLLTARGQHYLVNAKRKPRFQIERDFTRVEEDGGNFHAALVSEAARAVRTESTIWASTVEWAIFPFDELWFLRHIEAAPLLEMSEDLVKSIQEESPYAARRVARRLLEGERPSVPPGWSEFMATVSHVIPSVGSFERKQFLAFVKAMKRFELGRLPSLPPFRASEVGCWRAFTAVYPRSLKMFDAIIRESQGKSDIMFSAAMLPVLALSEDGGIRSAVDTTLHSIRELAVCRSVNVPEDYPFRREMMRSVAESGDSKFTDVLVDLVAREGFPHREEDFLSEYGWHSRDLKENIERKLNRPRRRDEKLRRLYETMGELLLPRG